MSIAAAGCLRSIARMSSWCIWCRSGRSDQRVLPTHRLGNLDGNAAGACTAIEGRESIYTGDSRSFAWAIMRLRERSDGCRSPTREVFGVPLTASRQREQGSPCPVHR